MTINRQNYQIWITDYYDGQLDEFQKEVLMDFLSANPDIRSEFDDYPGLMLSPDNNQRVFDFDLLHTPDQLTNEQVEHYAIAFLEGDLKEKQTEDILELEKNDPRFRENISIYKKLRLVPDGSEFPVKKDLKSIPDKRKTVKLLVNTISVAASIAILAGLFLIFNKTDNYTGELVFADNEPLQLQPDMNETVNTDIPVINESHIRYIPPVKHTASVETVKTTELKEEKITGIVRIPVQVERLSPISGLKLDNRQTHFLLADMEPYNIAEPMEDELSVREFLAYNFRKKVLSDENPDIDRLKTWELADAGVKGVNLLLGWNMKLETEQSSDGRLSNISFTSELLKFNHKSDKNVPGL